MTDLTHVAFNTLMIENLSLVIIAMNAEASIEQCLKSASWIRHKIVVDSGSTDRTVEIARQCGATVIHQDWLGFGPQKQFAVMQAPTDWVLCLDTDEFLTEELSQSIRDLFSSDKPRADAYKVARRNKFLGRYLRYGEGYPDWLTRLFDRRKAQYSDDPVHETVLGINGKIRTEKLSGDLMHDPADSISYYIEKRNRYTDIQARLLVESGKHVSPSEIMFSPFLRFLKYFFFKRGFLDGIPGFIYISFGCLEAYLKYIKAFSLQKKKNQHL